jgi:K+-transporting ATPase ATPase C chain
MTNHLRANLWLLLLTVGVCSVLYPLTLLGIGQTVFPEQAQGSLIRDKDQVYGSRLIARPFSGDEYFQPRPSAAGDAGYDARASGASNWGASNYKLRNRVARQLGPIVRYGPDARKDGKEPGELVGPDIEKWFQQDRYRDPQGKDKTGIVAWWAKRHSGLAEDWVKDTGKAVRDHWLKSADAVVKAEWEKKTVADSFADQWQEDLPWLYALWHDQAQLQSPSTKDLAAGFFKTFSAQYPGYWPYLDDDETRGVKRKRIWIVQQGGDVSKGQNEIQAVFFDLWRQDHPKVDLLEAPADMVTASASGLDPHITLQNALYQARWRVAQVQADNLIKENNLQADEGRRKAIKEKVYDEIVKLLNERAAAPLGGLVGAPLVNVLEVNLELRKRMGELGNTLR